MENLFYSSFANIDIDDPFFASLIADYAEFPVWFAKKAAAGECAYVLINNDNVQGFMYLKSEVGEVLDTEPNLPNAHHLKVGTFKFDSHGTRLGERFIKKVFDHALEHDVDDIYVTVFDKHDYLIKLFERYGFNKLGEKKTQNGTEFVLFRDMRNHVGDIHADYPFMSTSNNNQYLLGIYPMFHTRMLPDSILNNETHDIIQDVSHTNSIHKIYICGMQGVENLKMGDQLVIYRTSDGNGPARFRSVVTSIGVVEEYKNLYEFANEAEFLNYCKSYSVFSQAELRKIYKEKRYVHVIRFTYNVAMSKRVIRDTLLEAVGLNEDDYFGFLKLSDQQFKQIAGLGEINASLIVD